MGEFVFDPGGVEAALAAAEARFPAVAQRVWAVYGLRLPRHMAVFAAFADGIGADGRRALSESVGLRPGGIARYLEADGLAVTGRDGLDERLEGRFRCDPPEFVTVLWGDSDGLHFGLWYDDPEEPPSFVAHNYARDSAETWTEHRPTVLAQIAGRLDDVQADIEEDEGHEYGGEQDREQLRRALEAYGEADQRAQAQERRSRWADAARPNVIGGLGPALPEEAGDALGGHGPAEERYGAYRSRAPQVLEWIAQAQVELAAGKPAFALVLGRELHWLDAADYHEAALSLLTGAYRALGRDALAEIAEVHYAHRDLRSVDVLTR